MSELTPNPRPTELPAKGNICDLFLSYNSGDLASVREIQSSLSERQIITFFDRQSLVAGKPWLTALDDALRKVRAVAVFIGKDGLGMWQKREVSVALDRQAADERAGREFPVIPILLPEADIERAPSFLYLNTWIDLRGSLKEPESMDALVRAVLRQPPLPAIKASVALCPYRALRAFREEDAQLFFGREHFAEKLLEKVRAHALVAVVGPSGSGKSSVAQAGLLPLLRRESSPSPAWEAIICAPGKRPFHNLAAALIPLWEVGQDKTEILIKTEKLGSGLADGSVSLEAAIKLALKESPGTDRLLIIVDQFEELLTLTPEAERKKFLDTLLGSLQSSLSTVMLTIRDDFYGPAIALSRELSDMIPQGQINLGPMRVEELQRAVEQPAQSVGLDFEAGLVSRILDHVRREPGNLPLLEFAMTELWEHRQGTLLKNREYDEIGGVEGAIGKRAEEQFAKLATEQQEIALRVFTRLVRVGAASEGEGDARQRIKLSDLKPIEQGVAQSFTEARLLVVARTEPAGEVIVEVAHEALLQTWGRLRDRLSEDRKFLLWRQRIDIMMNEWLRVEQDKESLLHGRALYEAQGWLRDRPEDLSEGERNFVTKSYKRQLLMRKVRYFGAAISSVGIIRT